MSYIGGKTASKLFGIAFLGVLVIDYSINKFGEEAWKARTDIYRKAYNHYYENRVEGKRKGERTARDWARVFLDARKTARSAEAYNIRIQGLVDRYVNEAWKDPEKVFEYVSDDMTQSGIGMGGGGYTEAVRKRISDEYAKELYCGVLQEAFKLIADRDVRVAQANVLKELNVVKAELNKNCTLELYDSTVTDAKTKSDMAGATVSVTLPDNITDKDQWSTTLDNEGKGQIEFTLLACLMAGMPTELRVYKGGSSQNDAPDATIAFAVEDYTQRVDIGVEALPLAEILGSYDGELSLNSVSISDAAYQAYISESSQDADDGDTPSSKAECDTALNAMLQEYPLSIDSLSISSDAPESGQCVISVTVSNSKGESYPGKVSARYESGFLITEGEKGESRITVTKGVDGTISIAGNDVALGVQDEETGGVELYVMANIDVAKVS